MGREMKVIIADDAILLREGLAQLLQRLDYEVLAQAHDAPSLIEAVEQAAAENNLPEVIITDVRMPPNMSDDGLRAAVEIREKYPEIGIMVLSQYVAPAYATTLINPKMAFTDPNKTEGGTGYLLKERVSRVADFVRSLRLVADGGTVIDSEVGAKLMNDNSSLKALLTPREYEVLSLIARGHSNEEICAELFLSPGSVAKYVSNIFLKLGLPPEEPNRRVRAVLAFLADKGIEV